MNEKLLSKDELLSRGWTKRQIEAALDEPDEVGPSGHWLNASGRPYYDRERAEVAEYRIGLSPRKPFDCEWGRWKNSQRPTCIPELTLDFHRLAEHCVPGSARQLWPLRLSHPVLGRRPGTRTKEGLLVEDILMKIGEHSDGIRIATRSALNRFLHEKAFLAAQRLGLQWPMNVLIRPAKRAGYVSKARGQQVLKRAIDAMSLVYTGQVVSPDGQTRDLVELLISSPRLRFDLKSLTAFCRSPEVAKALDA